MAVMAHNAEAVAAARRMYEEGAAVRTIVRETGLSEGTLYYWLDGGPSGADERLAPLPRRRGGVIGQRQGGAQTSRASLIARLWRTAERQVADIETRLIAVGGGADSLEKDAKTLAVLARTVRDLVALDQDTAKETAKETADQADEEAPRDLDSFRRELADKIAQLEAEEAAAPAS